MFILGGTQTLSFALKMCQSLSPSHSLRARHSDNQSESLFFMCASQVCRLSIDVYIYIYIYAVELKTGPRFGVSSVKNWSKSSVKNWSNFFLLFFPQFYSVWGAFLETQIVQQCVKMVFFAKFGGYQK